MDDLLQDYAQFAEDLADMARPIVMATFRGDRDTDLGVTDKPDASPVTVADRAAEAAIRHGIEAKFPDHGIIGEEYGSDRADAAFVWVLDPIDGTRAYISGLPLFGTLIALCHDGVPVVGVIDHPALEERWVGVAGAQTAFNGAAVTTRACARLGDAILFATSPDMFAGADSGRFAACAAAAKQTRYGTDCYGYAMVASGYGDLVIEGGMGLYDYLALRPVVESAGGKITDWQGRALTLASTTDTVVAAGDERVHQAALALLGS